MITLGRQFDMQMDMIKKADENAAKASQIMNLS
jgi:flagellar basal body rod protein FlgF